VIYVRRLPTVVEIARALKMPWPPLSRERLARRILSDPKFNRFHRTTGCPAPTLAKRFAAKEAFVKALARGYPRSRRMARRCGLKEFCLPDNRCLGFFKAQLQAFC